MCCLNNLFKVEPDLTRIHTHTFLTWRTGWLYAHVEVKFLPIALLAANKHEMDSLAVFASVIQIMKHK